MRIFVTNGSLTAIILAGAVIAIIRHEPLWLVAGAALFLGLSALVQVVIRRRTNSAEHSDNQEL